MPSPSPRSHPTEYTEIVRYFREVADDDCLDDRRLRRYLRSNKQLTWESLLTAENHAIVLLAASGTGKTTELRQQSRRRQTGGKSSVYCEAAAVADDGLEASLAQEDASDLGAWSSRDDRPCLFVDAVDELYLRQRRFSDLRRRFGRSPTLSARDCLFVFSARNGSWSRELTQELRALLMSRGISNPQVKMVTFEPLDPDALRLLVEAHGAQDPDAFMQSYEQEEMDTLLDLRPYDVSLLARRWREHGRFGRWSLALKEFVDAAFEEDGPTRYRPQTMTPADGWRAIERIAATTVMMKTPHAGVPTVRTPVGAINSRRLFDEWSAPKLAELFDNPLFVHKGSEAEAVQLPQGGITYYLASRWFAERARQGWPIAALRDALLVHIFDEDRYRIPESRRALVGWVASTVSELREELIEDYPQVVLYEGDPDQLADQEIRAALTQLVRRLDDDVREEVWPSKATLRRLARPSLEPAVADLLGNSDACSREACRHLLAWATAGHYTSCVSWALRHALNREEDASTRADAINLIAAAGDATQRESLLPLLDDASEAIRTALLKALVPDHLRGQALVTFLATGGDTIFCTDLRRVVEQIGAEDLRCTLATLSSELVTGTVDGTTHGKLNVALVLLPVLLANREAVPDDAVDLLAAIERLSDHSGIYIGRTDKKAINQALSVNTDARRRLWHKRFEGAARWPATITHLMTPSFGDVQGDDCVWLADRYQDANNRDDHQAQGHIWWPLARALADRDAGQTIRPDLPSTLPTSVAERLALQAKATADCEREQQSREKRERQRSAALRRKDRTALEARRQAIDNGDDIDALAWAWQHMRTTDNMWARTDPDSLPDIVGDEWTATFIRGLKRFWRKQDVPLPEPGANTPTLCFVGLTGLALDVRDGLDVAALSPQEAALAARYALHELNAFPPWFPDLLAAHKELVANTLREATRREWASESDSLPVLRFAAYGPPHVAATMRNIVVAELESTGPARPQTIHYAVNVLLTSSESAARIAHFIEREVDASGSDSKRLIEWLRAWVHFAPERAADRMESALERNAEAATPILLKTARLVEDDFDGLNGFTVHTSLMAPRALARWTRLMMTHVRREDDLRHAGVYSPGDRDHAQDLRDRCLSRLARDVSPEAHHLLRQLAAEPAMAPYSKIIARKLREQRAGAAEAAAAVWSEEDVVGVERGDEKKPATLEELFSLVQQHIAHVAALIENDDFSYRGLFSTTTKEREIQLWVASCLRERSRGLYAIVRENVVDDDKKVDISAFAPGVGSIPIEIKPANRQRYSFTELKTTIDQQLLGKYMQPSDRTYGILLVVQHEKRSWRPHGQSVDLRGLVRLLQDHAHRAAGQTGKSVRVLAINLLPSTGQKAPAKRTH